MICNLFKIYYQALSLSTGNSVVQKATQSILTQSSVINARCDSTEEHLMQTWGNLGRLLQGGKLKDRQKGKGEKKWHSRQTEYHVQRSRVTGETEETSLQPDWNREWENVREGCQQALVNPTEGLGIYPRSPRELWKRFKLQEDWTIRCAC